MRHKPRHAKVYRPQHGTDYSFPRTFPAAHREYNAWCRLGDEHRFGVHCNTCAYVGRHRADE